MKIISIIVILTLNTFSFAAEKDISVVVDGISYQCSQGASSNQCASKAIALSKKYDACKESYGSSTCFNNTFNNFDKSCGEVTDVCYESCKESYGSSTCFNSCY